MTDRTMWGIRLGTGIYRHITVVSNGVLSGVDTPKWI